MKVVTRHLAKEILVATSFVLFALVALFAFFDIVGQASKIGSRYDFGEAVILTVLNLPTNLYQVMPIAALLGAVYTMSRWAANSEFTILRVSGLSPIRLAGMLAVPAALPVLVTYGLGEWVAPAADKMRGELRTVLLNSQLSAKGFASGVWVKDIVRGPNGEVTNVRFVNVHNLIAGEDSRTGAWRVFEFDNKGDLSRVIHAPGATFIPRNGWHLESATVDELPEVGKDDQPAIGQATHRSGQNLMLPSSMRPDILGVLTVKPESMGIADLYRYLAHLKESRQTTDRYEVALWTKVFYPLAIFVMLAVAMPFAYLNARSGGVSIKIFAGLMIGISFYAFNNIFSFLGVLNTWSPMLIAVFPTVFMLVLASVALWFVEQR